MDATAPAKDAVLVIMASDEEVAEIVIPLDSLSEEYQDLVKKPYSDCEIEEEFFFYSSLWEYGTDCGEADFDGMRTVKNGVVGREFKITRVHYYQVFPNQFRNQKK